MDEEAAPVAVAPAVDVISASPDVADARQMDESSALERRISDLTAQVRELAEQLSEHTSLARHREQTISHLHDEIQELRKGELSQALTPMIRDLIRLHDDLAAFVAEEEQRGRDDAEKAIGYFRDETLRILDRNDVEGFDPLRGDRFDPTQHRATRAVPSGDPGLDRTIESVLRRGFRRGPRVIRAAEVAVYRSDSAPRIALPADAGSSVKGEPS